MNKTDQENIESALSFWFEEIEPKQQFIKDLDFDALIRERFLGIYEDIIGGKTETWRETAEGRLAEISILTKYVS